MFKNLCNSSRMCINPIHNKKGILHQSIDASSEQIVPGATCLNQKMQDVEFSTLAQCIPCIILISYQKWLITVASGAIDKQEIGILRDCQCGREDLRSKSLYSNILLSHNCLRAPLSLFMKCKDQNNRSAILVILFSSFSGWHEVEDWSRKGWFMVLYAVFCSIFCFLSLLSVTGATRIIVLWEFPLS
ncbi:unnamed protein product [Coffea canephora]|uniref:Uncharacterized protein n=1 Tax=Coffea canephora TaxID=49390 RepID=A0A068UPR1_COFCA|nr:unnamed protein product [Coffea canephora]